MWQRESAVVRCLSQRGHRQREGEQRERKCDVGRCEGGARGHLEGEREGERGDEAATGAAQASPPPGSLTRETRRRWLQSRSPPPSSSPPEARGQTLTPARHTGRGGQATSMSSCRSASRNGSTFTFGLGLCCYVGRPCVGSICT